MLEKSSSHLQTFIFNGLVVHICYKPSRYMRINIRPSLESSQPIIKLTCPPRATDEAILAFIQAHKEWIDNVCARMAQVRGEIVAILQKHCDEVLLFGKWVPTMPLIELRAILHTYLVQRADVFANAMGVCFSKLAVRKSMSRLGSCTQDRLSFSILLVFAPKEEIDYVVIHELAHIVHNNHSAQFWELVGAHCPRWRSLRKSIKSRWRLFSALLDRLEQESSQQAKLPTQASPQSHNADIGSQLLFDF